MARIRSIKPEFFTSETLKRVEKSTRLTFIGLWTYVDDNGVGVDNAKLITAALYPLEDDFAEELNLVIADLDDLEGVGVIQRYTVAGRALFFIKSWDEHQKISHPSKPRYHRPNPGPGNPPGDHPGSTRTPPEARRRNSGEFPATLPGPENGQISDVRLNSESNSGHLGAGAADSEETAGQISLWQSSGDAPDGLRQSSALSREQGAGSRVVGIREQGFPPPAGGEPPATGRALELVRPATVAVVGPTTVDQLVADWIDHVPHRPPGPVIGRIGKSIKTLLAEGVRPDHIRAGLAAWARKGADPSSLPSFVNQAMNASAVDTRPSTTDRAVASGDTALAEFRRLTGRATA